MNIHIFIHNVKNTLNNIYSYKNLNENSIYTPLHGYIYLYIYIEVYFFMYNVTKTTHLMISIYTKEIYEHSSFTLNGECMYIYYIYIHIVYITYNVICTCIYIYIYIQLGGAVPFLCHIDLLLYVCTLSKNDKTGEFFAKHFFVR